MLNQRQIEDLEKRRRAAMVAEDVKTLESLLDDSLVWVHGSAKKDSKASFLAGFAGSGPKYLEFELSDVVIRCFDKFAIVNGIQKLRCIIQGAEFNRSTRFVNVWSAQDGEPRMMTWQSTLDFLPQLSAAGACRTRPGKRQKPLFLLLETQLLYEKAPQGGFFRFFRARALVDH